MQLREYLRIVLARWWLVLLAVVFAGAAAYLYTRTQTPVYRSTGTLVLVPARPDNGQTLAAQNLSRQAPAVITTERMARAVDERGQFDLGPDALRSKVRASAMTEQALIILEVSDTDPERARRIASAYLQEYAERQADGMATVDPRDRINAEVNDQPRRGEQIVPQTRNTVLAGVLLGLAVGVALAFAAEWLDDTYHGVEDVERGTGLVVLGAIPQVSSRAGGRAQGVIGAQAR